MRYRALIEYDGTDYYGFQRQRIEPTIQGEIEKTLEHINQIAVPIVGAGRTDSGVHATGQVIAFDLSWRHGTLSLLRALNANLPEDIVVVDLEVAEEGFHPRFDAQSRIYTYYIYNQTVRSPIWRRQSWHVRRSLNLDLMNQVSALIVGEHDFATFGQAPKGDNTRRCVTKAGWHKERKFLVFQIEANAYLTHMVRNIVGNIKVVGEGEWTVTDFSTAFAACDRSESAKPAPPCGLFLTSVSYS